MFWKLKSQIKTLLSISLALVSIFAAIFPLSGFAQSNSGGPTCDITQGCFIFSYKGYIRNSDGTVTLSVEITNPCKYDMSYIAFELPAGTIAKNPRNSNSQFDYTIDNTTNNPFTPSLKFSPNGKDYQSGASDILTYTLPGAAFNSMTSFQVQAHAGSETETVTFNPKGCCTNQVAISGPTSVCPNTSQTYSVANISGVSFYEWKVPTGWIINSGQGTKSISVKPNTTAGNVSIQQGLASCGTSAVSILPTSINAPSAISGPSVVCNSSTYSYEVPAVTNATSYSWTVPSGWQIIGNAVGNKISVKASNTNGNITVKAKGACVTSTATSLAVTIDPTVSITGGISGEANPCPASTQTYSITTTNAGSYSWTLPTGYSFISGQGTNNITVLVGNSAGTIKVTATSPNSCNSATSNLSITPKTLPVITSNPASVTATKGSNVTFQVAATGSGLAYKWQVNTGSGWTDIANNTIYSQATTTVLQLTSLPIYFNGYQFRAVVSSCNQEVFSTPATLTVNPSGVVANIKVLLEGPYNTTTGLMNTDLNTANMLPLNQPYNFSPWNYAGNETLASNFFNRNPTIVDWVLVELRTGTTPSTSVITQACLLKNNGTVVDLDGTSVPSFPGVQAGSYYLIVHHRNHLSVMSKTLQALNNNSLPYDFTSSYKMAIGTNPIKKMLNGKWAMYTGDANSNGSVTTSDWGSYWLIENGQNGYQKADWNLDGVVNQADYTYWYINGGLTTQVLR